MFHTKTRKRELVDSMFNLGLCIFYDRVLSTSTDLGNKLCGHYEVEKAACPPNVRSSLFTNDNIDHTPSSTSAHDSFHGNGIPLFQHQSSDSRGVQRVVLAENHDVSSAGTKTKLSKLPESYTTVPPLALWKRDVPVPFLDGPTQQIVSFCIRLFRSNVDKYVGMRVQVERLNESCLIQHGKHVNWWSITMLLQMAWWCGAGDWHGPWRNSKEWDDFVGCVPC